MTTAATRSRQLFVALCEQTRCSLDFYITYELRSDAECADWLRDRVERFGGVPPAWAEIEAAVHHWRSRPGDEGVPVRLEEAPLFAPTVPGRAEAGERPDPQFCQQTAGEHSFAGELHGDVESRTTGYCENCGATAYDGIWHLPVDEPDDDASDQEDS